MLAYPRILERRRTVESEAEVLELATAAARPPASLPPVWRLPCARYELLEKLHSGGGPPVRCPRYAEKRSVWIYSRAGTRAEVLEALAQLRGWTLSPIKGGYELGRGRPPPARDAMDLHRKLRMILPPSIIHQLRASGNTARSGREMDPIVQEISTLAGKDWNEYRWASSLKTT